MIVYAESSAVLAWLLGEPTQDLVIAQLNSADQIVTSALTVVECSRALRRAGAERRISRAQEATTLRLLDEVVDGWHRIELTDTVLEGARRVFPEEPVRSLDALHLSSALLVADSVTQLAVLSLDARVRRNALALGLRVLPAELASG